MHNHERHELYAVTHVILELCFRHRILAVHCFDEPFYTSYPGSPSSLRDTVIYNVRWLQHNERSPRQARE